MNYTRKANPNATNSELDAKRIITHKQLTISVDEQYQLVKLYETMLDMDMIDDLPIEIENVFDRIREAK